MWSPDHPDPALGAALWAALSPRNDTAAFVARVLGRRAVRVGGRDAGPRRAAGRGVPGGGTGTRRDDWLPERAVGPHGGAARLGAGDSGASPRRCGEDLARGPSAIRFGAVGDEH